MVKREYITCELVKNVTDILVGESTEIHAVQANNNVENQQFPKIPNLLGYILGEIWPHWYTRHLKYFHSME